MGSRWAQAPAAAGYALLPAGEESAGAPALHPQPSGHPPAPQRHSHHHTALSIPSDREHAVAQALLAAAHQEAPYLFAQLGTSTEGLSEEDAAARLARHGPNLLATRGAAPWYRWEKLAWLLWAAVALRCAPARSHACAMSDAACVLACTAKHRCAPPSVAQHRPHPAPFRAACCGRRWPTPSTASCWSWPPPRC